MPNLELGAPHLLFLHYPEARQFIINEFEQPIESILFTDPIDRILLRLPMHKIVFTPPIEKKALHPMKATIALIAKHAYHPLSENIEFVEFLLLIEFF